MTSTPSPARARRFAEAVDRPDDAIDLGEAALLLAEDAYPAMSVERYLATLDGIAGPLAEGMSRDLSLAEMVSRINGHLFGDEAFRGNVEEYYDPRNSYLNEVLDRRLGIPITLSIVYMEVSRRIGLEVVGIGLPGHFVVEARKDGDSLLLDPFHGGEILTPEDCQRLVAEVYGDAGVLTEEHLEPVTKRQILTRILNNLKMAYLRLDDIERAWPVAEKMVHLDPLSPVDRRDRGLLAHRRNDFRLARDDLRFYLDHRRDAPDRSAIEASLSAIEAILAMMT
jgi:regulator of sirC expression with transglutaminase-like and TPR domain